VSIQHQIESLKNQSIKRQSGAHPPTQKKNVRSRKVSAK